MARYILIQVDDNEAAKLIVEDIQKTGELAYQVEESELLTPAKVIGLFAKPTQFCDCPNPGDRVAKGTKWGWLLHSPGCNKPRRNMWQHARNLLHYEKAPATIAESRVNVEARRVYIGVREPLPDEYPRKAPDADSQ